MKAAETRRAADRKQKQTQDKKIARAKDIGSGSEGEEPNEATDILEEGGIAEFVVAAYARTEKEGEENGEAAAAPTVTFQIEMRREVEEAGEAGDLHLETEFAKRIVGLITDADGFRWL